jgi:hypothetical protein
MIGCLNTSLFLHNNQLWVISAKEIDLIFVLSLRICCRKISLLCMLMMAGHEHRFYQGQSHSTSIVAVYVLFSNMDYRLHRMRPSHLFVLSSSTPTPTINPYDYACITHSPLCLSVVTNTRNFSATRTESRYAINQKCTQT